MKNDFDDLAFEVARLMGTYTKFAGKYHFNYNELHFLYYLARYGTATAKDISQKWSLKKQNINFIQNKFIKLGYIALEVDSKDHRKKNLKLTSKGEDAIQPLITRLNQAELATQKEIGQEELAKFVAQFKEINNKFSKNLD